MECQKRHLTLGLCWNRHHIFTVSNTDLFDGIDLTYWNSTGLSIQGSSEQTNEGRTAGSTIHIGAHHLAQDISEENLVSVLKLLSPPVEEC